jgi:hypothetical protein
VKNMKKTFSLVLFMVLALSVASFGAVKTAPAPASETTPSSSSMGITAVSLNSLGFPSVRFGMGSWDLEVGGQIASPASGTTNLTIGGRAELPLSKIGDSVRTYMAPTLVIQSLGGTSFITASFLLGAEYMFASHLAIFADLTAFTLTSTSGNTSWCAGQNHGQIYTGGRLYL